MSTMTLALTEPSTPNRPSPRTDRALHAGARGPGADRGWHHDLSKWGAADQGRSRAVTARSTPSLTISPRMPATNGARDTV